MDRLITVRDMRERYGCSLPTARKYLRKCIPHMEDPLVAPEWAVREWEESRTVIPQKISRRRTDEIIYRRNEQMVVPRTW